MAGFVLAGGRSSRMGRDKALLVLDGERLVARALRTLGEVCGEVAIAGGAAELAEYGRVIGDARPGCGPLGGMVAALEQTDWEWNAFLAVDVPFVPASAWRQMRAWVEGSGAVAVWAGVGGVEQPLCGVYARECAGRLREELEAGRWKVRDAVGRVGGVHVMEFGEADWFRNFNTPEEFGEVAGRSKERDRLV